MEMEKEFEEIDKAGNWAAIYQNEFLCVTILAVLELTEIRRLLPPERWD